MAVSFTRFSWWLWGGKEKDPVSNSPSLNSASDWGFSLGEPENVKFPLDKGTKIAPSPKKVKRKWQSREERRIDREYDVVLVPSDGGGCLSGSDSDDSDWSIGWLEPHGPDFQSDDESDNSFAVLVPCYSPGCKDVVESSDNELLSAIKNLPDEFSSGKNYMEQWLASIQNFEV
ncbi:Ribosomal RNA small subunit methyltransferase A [Quillaja saponaria]|uniref:Ribosomal RNA small subunit methyltransferase A n=1 Tax=Quillaja saponaria TaxID=32244 RepID=A0AAD7PG08_QUISA|nr:Ribosomal RNA small subunit methyltransferase A [Quillaja saponaria]